MPHPHTYRPGQARDAGIPTPEPAPVFDLLYLLRLRADAWYTERVTDAQLRLQSCQQRRTDAQATTTLTALDAQRRVAEAARAAAEAEAEYHLRQALREASPEVARRILGHEIETTRLLQLRERLKSAPSTPAPVPPPVPALPSGNATLDVQYSDQQIESLAVRALTRFSHLEPGEAQTAWQGWEAEARERLPAYAAAEVIRRAQELRGLLK